jgi:uncharacterized LabA/DUF88 family protein
VGLNCYVLTIIIVFLIKATLLQKKKANATLILIQKRIDVLLAVDLTNLSTKGAITHVSILTGDSDYLPAIRTAKDQGVNICLCHSAKHHPHRELWQTCDERKILTADVIQNILR